MQTYTQTHTATYARHIASKVAADLKRLQRLYRVNRPTDKEIDEYQTEAFMLLSAGYLGEVTYGFKRNGNWIAALKYRAVGSQLVGTGDDPGGIRATENIAGAPFSSFLSYADVWWDRLTQAQRDAFKATLPVSRVSGHEPDIENGRWVSNKNYASGPLGVQRSTIQRY